MKYIDVDQLKAGIERLAKLNKECAKVGGDKVFLEGITAGYADILSFLKSLPEQSMEGLEDEYVRFVRTDHHQYQDLIGNGGLDLARHFAEWGAEHSKK
jgi:hypothetical protein